MKSTSILVTGASGEVGHSLINHFSKQPNVHVVGLDLRALSPSEHNQQGKNSESHVELVSGNILDCALLEDLFARHQFTHVFHLAAILSSSGERDPLSAHRINVEGSLNLLRLSREIGLKRGTPTTFVFPSTIAVYGIPSSEAKRAAGCVTEGQFLSPITMYGINKLYVENLGRYFASHFGSLLGNAPEQSLDFRCVRFPGILSADSVPSGGTSDYGPEMIHAAAQAKPYRCFVPADARLPFLSMPDAVSCLVSIAQAARRALTQPVYNINGFSITAGEIRQQVLKFFPKADITYEINPARHRIVESWPAEVDETAAARDWGWKPHFDRDSTFSDYLIPRIKNRYQPPVGGTAVTSEKILGAFHV